MCQLYTASKKNNNNDKKEIENISLKKFHIFLIFPLILSFDKDQYNCRSSYNKKTFFFLSQSVHLLGKHSFPKLRYFLCVINATIFCTHYIFKVHSKKDEESTFHSSKCPFSDMSYEDFH